MKDPDYDEDLYEEKSRLVYKRRSSTSQHDLFKKSPSARTDSDDRSPPQPFRGHAYSETPTSTLSSTRRPSERHRIGRRASWSEMSRITEPVRDELEFSTDEPLDSSGMDGTVEIRKVKKVWSYKTIHGSRRDEQSDGYGKSADQSSYGGRDDLSTVRTEDTGRKSNLTPAEQHVYCPVAKWDVDYTNRNYVRSKCNKPIGLHRHTLGRQFKWDVDYDNSHYLRSKVNEPKGLHRRKKDIKRKRVPDNDVLADSTGWEFEYGPEFLQVEEDVPYMPDERVVGRGAYRCYGVGRSHSDTDVKDEDKRKEIPGLNEDEFKYGTEFLQDDVQHTLEQKDGTIGRGAYRFYDADRSHCDKIPCDMMGIDYRESRARLENESEESEEEKEEYKGKPFKRTVLKKTLKLSQRPSDEKLFGDERYKYGTHLKFVPGMGTRTTYEGAPTKEVIREGDLQVKQHPSIRSVFKKTNKTCSYSCGAVEEGFHCEKKFSHKHFWDELGSGKSNGNYSVSKPLYPKEKKASGVSYRTHDSCDLCERKEIPGKIRKTPERSYEREGPRKMRSYEREAPRKDRRPPAESLTSYESCNLCERKEVPGMRKKTVDKSDSNCVICEKKKVPGKSKKMSPNRGPDYSRGMGLLTKGYAEKQKKTPEGSHASFDCCDLCDKKEVPRVATPKIRKESQSIKRSPVRDTYAEKTKPPFPKSDKLYRGTETYETRRKPSAREGRAPEGEKFRKWREMEKRETRPLRMTGSISQRQPRNTRKEPKIRDLYQRHVSQYACPVEIMDDEDDDDVNDEDNEDEEMSDEIPPCVQNRINEIKEEMSEVHDPRERRKGSSNRLTGSSSQKRTAQNPREPKHKELFGRHQDEFVFAGELMNEERDLSSEEFVPHVESKIGIVKKPASRTRFSAHERKDSPKRTNGSTSLKHPTNVRNESKHKDCFKKHGEKGTFSRGIKENGRKLEDLPSHSGSKIRTLAKKASPMKHPNLKGKSSRDFREELSDEFSDSDEMDFEEHQNHPKDHAKSFKDGYEKYVNKNGSEIWIKAEEKYSEVHHIP